jgi:hypothetical protein
MKPLEIKNCFGCTECGKYNYCNLLKRCIESREIVNHNFPRDCPKKLVKK